MFITLVVAGDWRQARSGAVLRCGAVLFTDRARDLKQVYVFLQNDHNYVRLVLLSNRIEFKKK